MSVKNCIFIFGLVAFCGAAISGDTGWSAQGKINDLRVYNDVAVNAGFEDFQLSCGTKSFQVSTNATFFKEIVAMLVAVQTSGMDVEVHQTGECLSNSMAVINGVRMVR